MKRLIFLVIVSLIVVPGVSKGGATEIDPGVEETFSIRDSSSPLDSPDDDPGFTLAEIEAGQASQSMAITSATVTFDPKKKDKFTVKGTTGALSLTGVQSVIFQAGSFSQEITIDKFTQSKQKYTYRGVSGGAGIASLVIDMPKAQFSATVQNLFLTGFTNPLPISLKAGTSSECSMAQFSVSGSKWTFSTSNPQYVCLMTQVPKASPTGLFVNTSKNVAIHALVPSNSGLNQNSVALYRVDDNLSITGGSLCTLLDNGNIGNGDQTAADNVYSCITTFQESSPGQVKLMVGAQLTGKTTYSPSFSLAVVTPYTPQQAQQTIDAHQQAGGAWQGNLAKYGDTKKARDETVKAVKKIDGVKDAGVSTDKSSIWIEFQTGIRGGLTLDVSDSGSRSGTTPVRKRAERTRPTLDRLCGSASDLDANGNPFGGISQPGNCGVFLWDLQSYDPGERSNYEIVFWNPNFSISKHFGYDCTVESLRAMTGFGTVIIGPGGKKGRSSYVYSTWDFVTFQNLQDEKFMLDLLTGCLEAWFIAETGTINYFFTPNFISTLEGEFPNSIVYVESEFSAELAVSFLGKKAHTFFGYTGKSDRAWMIDTGKKLFTAMVKDGKDTGEAYAAVPERSNGSSFFLEYSNSTTELAYDCEPVTAKAGIKSSAKTDFKWFYGDGSSKIESYDSWFFFPTNYQAYPLETIIVTANPTKDGFYTASWDTGDTDPRVNASWKGTMEITLDAGVRNAQKVLSFAAEQTFKWGNDPTSNIVTSIAGVGGNLPPPTRETTIAGNPPKSYETITFQINGITTCNSITSINYSDKPVNPDPNTYYNYKVATGYGCNKDSFLLIQFYLVK